MTRNVTNRETENQTCARTQARRETERKQTSGSKNKLGNRVEKENRVKKRNKVKTSINRRSMTELQQGQDKYE